jgi:hypothetical protein
MVGSVGWILAADVVMGFVFVWRVEREKNEGWVLGTDYIMYSMPTTNTGVACTVER